MKNNHTHHHNDPDYHDIRATVLLEASRELRAYAEEHGGPVIKFVNFSPECTAGILEAATQLRRMASNARRAHRKIQDRKKQERLASEAKARAFGYGD